MRWPVTSVQLARARARNVPLVMRRWPVFDWPGCAFVLPRSASRGMAHVRPGQAAAWPLVSARSVRRRSRVKRDFACTFTGAFHPAPVALRSQSRLGLEGRTHTLSGPSPDLSPARLLYWPCDRALTLAFREAQWPLVSTTPWGALPCLRRQWLMTRNPMAMTCEDEGLRATWPHICHDQGLRSLSVMRGRRLQPIQSDPATCWVAKFSLNLLES